MKLNRFIMVAGLLMTLYSCNKKLDILNNNNPTQESYFKNSTELEEGLNAVYSSLRSTAVTGREWFFLHDMRGGEVEAGGPQLEAPRMELLRQPNAGTNNSVVASMWKGLYRMINRANLVISKGPVVNDDTNKRDRIVGEAKFLRAWAYFELVSQWGKVPVYTLPVFNPTDFAGLSEISNIYDLILKDVSDAIIALPSTPTQLGRATKDAAYVLGARAMMQKGDYGNAKNYLLKVYGKYSLVPFLNNYDGDIRVGSNLITDGHEYNAESIFEVSFYDRGDKKFDWGGTAEGATTAATNDRGQEYGIVWGNVIPSNRTLNAFEPTDPRFKFTFWEEGDHILTFVGTLPGVVLTAVGMNVATSNYRGSVKKRIYRKYSFLDWINPSSQYNGMNTRLYRYTNVLLMLAECEAEAGSPSKAADYINEVRDRPGVGMPHISTPTKDAAIKAVMLEKTLELAGEEENNIDILRWRAKGYYTSLAEDPRLGQVNNLPIPLEETSANPALN